GGDDRVLLGVVGRGHRPQDGHTSSPHTGMAPPVWSEHRKSPGRRLLRLRFSIARVALHIFLPNRAALVRRVALHPAIDNVRAGAGSPGRKGVGFMGVVVALIVVVVVAVVVITVLASIKSIGPTEVGLVTKRVGFGKL